VREIVIDFAGCASLGDSDDSSDYVILAGSNGTGYDRTPQQIEDKRVSSPTRREKFEAMLATEPQDQFLRYALAMEYEKEGEHERSLEFLRGLMADDPPHVPSFFMAGQHLTKQDRIAERAMSCGSASSRLVDKATPTPPAR